MDFSQYRKYCKEQLKVVFHCKICTENAGQMYRGEVHIVKPALWNVSIDINIAEVPREEIMEEINPYIKLNISAKNISPEI